MMTFAQYQESLRYVRWSEVDASALRLLVPHVRPQTAAIAEEFYERIREHPEADRVFKDEAQVRRLQKTLQRWVLELLEGPYDERYFEQRCLIGAVHARVGIAQRYVTAAMTLVRLSLLRIADEAFREHPDDAARARVALGKVLDIELTVMLETYRAALMERLARVSRTEREGIAVRLAQAEERYKEAIESAQAVCFVLDCDRLVLLWNRRAAELTGYETDEVVGTAALPLIVPDDEAQQHILAVTPETPTTFESPMTARSGRMFHVRWLVSATRDPARGTPTIYVFAVDLTDLREAEDRAHQTERLAAVGTMAAGLAHEIRNPLNAASLHVQLLSRALARIEDVPAAATDAASVLRDEIRRLSALVTEFLAFARPRPLERTPTDLTELVTSVLELLRPSVEGTGVTLSFERPTRPVWATCDVEKMRQVLLNLVRNAIEALGERGSTTLRVRRVGSFSEIDVEDDGPGVPEGAPIFDAFYTTKEGGTGLGLALAHRLVGDHGGVLSVTSVPGHTVFTIRLPGAAPIAA